VPLVQPLREGAPIPITAGTNFVVASWTDWEPVTNQVVVEPGGSYDVSFRFAPGYLLVSEVRPERAVLELLDPELKPIGHPPAAGEAQALKPGKYSVRGRQDGYGEQTVPFTVLAGATNALSIRLQQDVGTLVLSTMPVLPGVKVIIQDTADPSRPPSFIGVLPDSGPWSTNLAPGTYTVRGDYPGLDSLAFTVRLAKNARVSTNLDFQYWTLSLASEPTGARVKLDGVDAGQTPLDRLVKRTGSNYFVLNLDEHYRTDAFWTNAPRAAHLSVARQLRVKPKAPASYTNTLGMALVQISDLPGCPSIGYMGVFEVSQAQDEQLMRTNPSSEKARGPELPVNYVSPLNAQDFCAKLTAADGNLGVLGGGFQYALPTEEQWRYCASNTPTAGAVLGAGLVQKPRPERVGTGPANLFGLHDVLGNVSELCSLPASDASFRALGGNYQVSATFAERSIIPVKKDAGFIYVGFRVVLVPGGANR
jgi:hypothetical protein